MPNVQPNISIRYNTNTELYEIVRGDETQVLAGNEPMYFEVAENYWDMGFGSVTNISDEYEVRTHRTDDVMNMENEEENIPMDKFDSLESIE